MKGDIAKAALPLTLELMSTYQTSTPILTEGLTFLSTLSGSELGLQHMQSAAAFDVVVDAVGSNMENHEVSPATPLLVS